MKEVFFVRLIKNPILYLHPVGEEGNNYIYKVLPGKTGAAVWYDRPTAEKFIKLAKLIGWEVEQCAADDFRFINQN